MKTYRFLGLGLLLALCAPAVKAQQTASQLQFKNVGELQQFLSYSPNRIPLISAHRGGPEKGYPENALETFQHTTLSQPVIIECDITLTKDSVMTLLHDNRLDRTTTGTGQPEAQLWADLQQLHLKDNNGDTTAFRLPLLDDVLQWGRNKVIFTLDIKRGVPYSKVVEAVRRNKAEASVVLITYSATQAAEVFRLAPDLMMSVSLQQPADLERLEQLGIPDNHMVAFIGTHEADAALYQLLHDKKILCILGTMGNLDKQAIAKGDQVYADFIDHGADILSTDRAAAAGRVLQQYRETHHLQSSHIKQVKAK